MKAILKWPKLKVQWIFKTVQHKITFEAEIFETLFLFFIV
jgi:hypothetical protein